MHFLCTGKKFVALKIFDIQIGWCMGPLLQFATFFLWDIDSKNYTCSITLTQIVYFLSEVVVLHIFSTVYIFRTDIAFVSII